MIASALTLAVGAAQADTLVKTPIVIGVTGDLEGYAQSLGAPWMKTADVWAQWINDNGGIQGHPVVLLKEDTRSDPATGAKALDKLLGNPKVVAVVHGGDDTTPATSAAIAKATAPVIGGLADDVIAMNPNVFPSSTTADGAGAAVGSLGVSANKLLPGGGVIYSVELGGAAAVPVLEAGARKAGGSIAYSVGITRADTDYSAQCLAAKAKNVGWITVVDVPATVASVAEACAKVGYKPTWVNGFFASEYLKVPALDGMKFIVPDAPFDSAFPAAEKFRRAMAKYDPDQLKQSDFGQYGILAWTSLQLLAKAIESAHPPGPEITRADVYRGLYSLKNETLGGLAPPLTFVRGKPTSISCYFTAQIKGGRLVAASDKPIC